MPELAQAQGPLRFYRQDIALVLDAMKVIIQHKEGAAESTAFAYIDLDRKNELNRLSDRYFRYMQDKSSAYFGQIEDFLKDPINSDLADTYDSIADDFNHRIIVHREDFGAFDRVFQFIYDCLIEGDPNLEKRNRLIFVLLHYMYWACDLGEKADDTTDSTS